MHAGAFLKTLDGGDMSAYFDFYFEASSTCPSHWVFKDDDLREDCVQGAQDEGCMASLKEVRGCAQLTHGCTCGRKWGVMFFVGSGLQVHEGENAQDKAKRKALESIAVFGGRQELALLDNLHEEAEFQSLGLALLSEAIPRPSAVQALLRYRHPLHQWFIDVARDDNVLMPLLMRIIHDRALVPVLDELLGWRQEDGAGGPVRFVDVGRLADKLFAVAEKVGNMDAMRRLLDWSGPAGQVWFPSDAIRLGCTWSKAVLEWSDTDVATWACLVVGLCPSEAEKVELNGNQLLQFPSQEAVLIEQLLMFDMSDDAALAVAEASRSMTWFPSYEVGLWGYHFHPSFVFILFFF